MTHSKATGHLNAASMDDLLNEAIVSTAARSFDAPKPASDAYFLGYLLGALRDRFGLANTVDVLETLGRLQFAYTSATRGTVTGANLEPGSVIFPAI